MDEKEQKKTEIEMQIRSLGDDVKSGKVKAADGLTKLAELRSNLEQVEKEIAQKQVQTRTIDKTVSLADVKEAMLNKRAITLSGTGNINQVKELYKPLLSKTPLLNGVQKFTGANASTNIPILSAYPATPAAEAEGKEGIDADTLAALGNKSLTPYAWVSILPVSAEAITMGSVDIEKELPGIFADSFAQGFHNSILTGDGTNGAFSGIFTNIPTANQVETATAGKLAISDLAGFALKISDRTDNGVIVMNSAVYQLLMADSSTDETTKLYKESLIRDKTVEGVQIMLTSGAPSATATGSTLMTALELRNYGMAIGGEVIIEPIKKLGSTLTYFQATAFSNGSLILPANAYSLVMQ